MTIYDIAKLANCSASTVSRVINNRGGVGSKKREEIESLLRQHNYVPVKTPAAWLCRPTI